jgi:hypothetical protein
MGFQFDGLSEIVGCLGIMAQVPEGARRNFIARMHYGGASGIGRRSDFRVSLRTFLC